MVETMGRTDTPKESIENLLQVRQMHFPEQPFWIFCLTSFHHLQIVYLFLRIQCRVTCGADILVLPYCNVQARYIVV